MKTFLFGAAFLGLVAAQTNAQSAAPAPTPAPTQGAVSSVEPIKPAPLGNPAAPSSAAASPACPVAGGSCPPTAATDVKKPKARSDSVFSALVLATNVDNPPQPLAELAGFAPKMTKVFGYNHFELIGSHTKLMDKSDEQWLVPSKLFSLSIKSKREKNASYMLNLQLFQEAKMLAGFDAKLGTESPIFIRGPLCGKGQLVIVVEVKQ